MMGQIIYVAGWLADQMGGQNMQALAHLAADASGSTVDVLTHGESEHHSKSRYTAHPSHKGETK